VSGKGELDVKVHFRGQVPDLLSRFSDEVRARAQRFVWWKSRYERRLLRAIRLMPEWAKETVRQHILHERAVRIEAKTAGRGAPAERGPEIGVDRGSVSGRDRRAYPRAAGDVGGGPGAGCGSARGVFTKLRSGSAGDAFAT